MYGGHTSKCEDGTTGVCCNIVLQFTNKQQGAAHRVVRYGTHSWQVRHTTDVKYDTHSCHVRSYVNDRSRAIPIQGMNVSRTRLRSYVTNNAYDLLKEQWCLLLDVVCIIGHVRS